MQLYPKNYQNIPLKYALKKNFIKWFIFFMYNTMYTVIQLLPMNNDLQKCVVLKILKN